MSTCRWLVPNGFVQPGLISEPDERLEAVQHHEGRDAVPVRRPLEGCEQQGIHAAEGVRDHDVRPLLPRRLEGCAKVRGGLEAGVQPAGLAPPESGPVPGADARQLGGLIEEPRPRAGARPESGLEDDRRAAGPAAVEIDGSPVDVDGVPPRDVCRRVRRQAGPRPGGEPRTQSAKAGDVQPDANRDPDDDDGEQQHGPTDARRPRRQLAIRRSIRGSGMIHIAATTTHSPNDTYGATNAMGMAAR